MGRRDPSDEARNEAAERSEWDDEMFAPARRLREADHVVIVALFDVIYI